MKIAIFFSAVMALTISPIISHAADQVGTLTQVEGTVKIFTNPGKKIQGPPPHALFEGDYYSVQDAKAGDKVEKGNIVRTAPGAKVRVVYNNGDQFNVGPATAYKISWDADSAKTKTQVNLMYGKLRGVVEKGGPRSKLLIRTRTATMGVRGTDFFIADGGAERGTEVSILRGAVEVKQAAPEAKPIEVKAGFSAEIPPPPKPEPKVETTATATADAKPAVKPAPAPVIELRQTTKEDLAGIQKSSTIKTEPKAELKKENEKPTALAEQLKKLEEKAVQTTLEDIKKEDPKLFAQIQNQPIKSTDEINIQVVQSLMKVAPKAPEKRKPSLSEIDDLESGAYDTYFKIVD